MTETLNVDMIKNKLRPIFDAYGIRRATLFGSSAKGTATQNSDIDILVDSGLKGLRFVGFLEALQSAVKLPVDLLDIRHIEKNSRIEREIQETGVVIYEK